MVIKKITKEGILTSKETFLQDLNYIYSGKSYFLSLEASNSRDDYHEVAIDPDGNLRDSLKERSLWLSNNIETINFVKRSSQLKPGAAVLDYGCGAGFLLSALSDDLHKYGVENSDLAFELAIHEAKVEKCLEALDGVSFDLIIANHVIEHLSNPVETIQKLIDFLKPGGEIVIGTPDFGSAMAHRFKENYRMFNEPTHISLFTLDSLLRLLRDLELEFLSIEFPFFDSPYFTQENLLRILDLNNVSPPFWGNFILVRFQKI